MPKPVKNGVRQIRDRKRMGWFPVHHDIFLNQIFNVPMLDEFSAFLSLVSESHLPPRIINVNHQPIPLKSGQVSHASEQLAKDWGWTPSRVWRFLQRLKKFQLIEISNEYGQQIITVLYDGKKWSGAKQYEVGNEITTQEERNLNDSNIKKLNTLKNFNQGTRDDSLYPTGEWVDRLRKQIPKPAFDNWFKKTDLLEGVFYAPDETTLRFIRQFYEHHIKSAYGREIEFSVRQEV